MSEKDNKKKFRVYSLALWVLALLPVVGITLFLTAIASGMFGELPGFEELENPKSNIASEIYSSDQVLLGKYYIQNRSNVQFDDLSPNLVNALKATEDIRFEEHSGVDIKGLFRVFFKTIVLRQEGAGGGSTLSQQLAKNLYKTRVEKENIIITKIKEWITAIRLERNYTKEEIMAMYLNTVEFGSNAFGIKSASQTFFNTSPDSLKVQEAAVLVGLLKAPTYYSPVRNPNSSEKRRNVVLGQMYKYDFLSTAEFDSLTAMPIELSYKADTHNEGLAPHFREYIRQELIRWCRDNTKADGTPYNLYRDGLRIYTTVNSRMQKYAEEAVQEHLTDLQKVFFDHWKGKEPWAPHFEILDQAVRRTDRYAQLKALGASEDSIKNVFDTKMPMTIFTWNGPRDTIMSPMDSIKYHKHFLQVGFMSMEPHTGYVRAWVGGIDHTFFKYDHVKDGKRQVGSTFKPFVYALAMQENYSPCFRVPNIPVTFVNELGQSWTPKNSDNEYGGMYTLKEALAKSINTITAYLMKQFGPQAVIDIARKMGITSHMDPFPSLALGTPDLSVYEMVGAYSTFANKGVYTEPIYITRIEDKNGIVLREFLPKKVEAISEETAYLMLNLLEGGVQFGTGARIRFRYKLNNAIAGKTGTTQNNSDGWFIGITPELVSGVWVGAEDRAVRFRSTSLGQGANMALPIWGLYMQKVYADKTLNVSQAEFEKPSQPLSVQLNCSQYQESEKVKIDFGSDYGF
ncbi:MAG: penicillin-binding protein 1A [Bacteroidia bacterium]